MEKLPTVTSLDQFQRASQSLTPQSQRPAAERLVEAATLAKRLLAGRPDYAGASGQYLAEIGEVVAGYEPDMQAKIVDLKTGVPSRCKYLPTPADIAEFVRAEADRLDQFKPAHTAYHRLKADEDGVVTTAGERKAHVSRIMADLTDSFSASGSRWNPPAPGLDASELRTNADLRTPPAPPSQKLIDLVNRQKQHNPDELWC